MSAETGSDNRSEICAGPRAPEAVVLQSTLTCPHCGARSLETMPTDSCRFFHECAACGGLIRPRAGDCCVFCSYGSEKCPSIQLRGCCAGD